MSHKITEDKILWNNKVPGSQSKGNSFLCLTWWHEMAWGKWTEVFPELLVVEDTGSLQIQRDWEVTHHLPQTTKRLILLSISCQWRGCPMSRLETTSVVKRMLGSGTYSAETRGSWRFPELQRHFTRQWSYRLNQMCSKNNSHLMKQLTSSHDSGVLMRPVSPSRATVCTLVPPQNMNCRRDSEVSCKF